MAEVKLAERITEIIGMLNNGESVNIKQLAEKFETSERTIQRDITERLRFLSLIKSDKGWRMDTQSIGKLSQKVIQNFAAISGIRDLYPSLDDDFLKSLMSLEHESAFLIKPHNYESLSNQFSKQLFSKLEAAITRKERIHFYYKAKDYQNIQPYKLVNYKGIWYLAAVDNGKLKTFHANQIGSVWQTKELFEYDLEVEKQINNEESIWFSKNKQEVVLKVDADISSYFQRRQLIPEQEITKTCDDGSLIVTTMVADDMQILPIIKYWIPHVKIISPSSLDDTLRKELKGYMY
ncbi:YafY family protein [Colwellia sp. BRX8-9]|uniref:helix-turn-helix transcriptional regulator n=1 Tax=Colwellia sp. BRX8-9 TaxID=2759831 RepID=UPI0015F58F36|nr:WYL domain-containing protein [Colwellia sp. BRX8-9]MBA6350080.1 WYL domain-containing protein [Colwellia sp. BRX8-9]